VDGGRDGSAGAGGVIVVDAGSRNDARDVNRDADGNTSKDVTFDLSAARDGAPDVPSDPTDDFVIVYDDAPADGDGG
jgi:hypothetical protein